MKITKGIKLIMLKIPESRLFIIVKLNPFRKNNGEIYIQVKSSKSKMMNTYLVMF